MKRIRKFHRAAAWMATAGMLLGQAVQAAAPTAPGPKTVQPAVADIGLHDGGVLRGQMLDSAGQPSPGGVVELWKGGAKVAVARGGAKGEFAFSDLSPGVHELRTKDHRGLYRLWATDTAPPAAQPAVLMVDGQDVLRGQQGSWLGNLGSALANPWILGLMVAGAIAIPLALDDDDAS